MDRLAAALADWYRENGRTFAWRSSRANRRPDPWAVVVSEFLLQQTQTSTVEPRFAEILRAIPTPEACATLTDAHLRWLWDGLGYYRRAENLRATARKIVLEYEGHVPCDAELLLDLPGVGPYTCGAIMAIAFDMPVAGVDGNITRAYLRVCGKKAEVNDAKADAELWLEKLYAHGSPRELMQALMDLGATVCTPRKPNCQACPIQSYCTAAIWPDPAATPLAPQGKTLPVSQLVHAWISDGKDYFFEWRGPGLLGERPAPLCLEANEPPLELLDANGVASLQKVLPPYRHTFTHRHWDVRPALYTWKGATPPSFANHAEGRWPVKKWRDAGLPKAFSKGAPEQKQLSLALTT